MPTLKHPTLPDVTVDVTDEQVDSWTEQGWLPDTPDKPQRAASTTTKGK